MWCIREHAVFGAALHLHLQHDPSKLRKTVFGAIQSRAPDSPFRTFQFLFHSESSQLPTKSRAFVTVALFLFLLCICCSMDESYTALPTSHLLGSVPAVTTEENNTTKHEVPNANMQIFPPSNGGDRGRGYQTLESPTEAFEQQPTNNWRGVFSVSSYTQYFNVDTDVVIFRLMSSLNPFGGDFFSKIDANPDLYGLVWISTTLVFVLASLGNLATYFIQKNADNSTSWSFDVSYVNVAACAVYGYAIVVPVAYYFFLQYMGSNASLIRFWCMWGYSLSIFIISSFLLMIPVEALRWLIIILTGVASAGFVASNLKSYIEGNDLSVAVIAAFCLQIALAVFIKVWFFA